jgi:hypothetical protein
LYCPLEFKICGAPPGESRPLTSGFIAAALGEAEGVGVGLTGAETCEGASVQATTITSNKAASIYRKISTSIDLNTPIITVNFNMGQQVFKNKSDRAP